MDKETKKLNDSIVDFLRNEFIPKFNSVKKLEQDNIKHDSDIEYSKRKEIEQNGLLRDLTCKVDKLDKKIDKQFMQLFQDLSEFKANVYSDIDKKFWKQNWMLITTLSIPLFLFILYKIFETGS